MLIAKYSSIKIRFLICFSILYTLHKVKISFLDNIHRNIPINYSQKLIHIHYHNHGYFIVLVSLNFIRLSFCLYFFSFFFFFFFWYLFREMNDEDVYEDVLHIIHQLVENIEDEYENNCNICDDCSIIDSTVKRQIRSDRETTIDSTIDLFLCDNCAQRRRDDAQKVLQDLEMCPFFKS